MGCAVGYSGAAGAPGGSRLIHTLSCCGTFVPFSFKLYAMNKIFKKTVLFFSMSTIFIFPKPKRKFVSAPVLVGFDEVLMRFDNDDLYR